MAKSVYEQIKKQNGERFAKAILWHANGIFMIPGIVDIVKYAGRDAEPIMDYLISLKDIQIEETGVYQDPITLLDKAGYDAYYVTNLEEQNRIQKYYASAEDLEKMGVHSKSIHGERLCTFRDPHRFEEFYIVNAVRKDVDQIRRETFVGKEKREDEYGTSVVSIQIRKDGRRISIKNRYNHTVEACDDTFNSNPDKIILGLSNALRHHFGVDFSTREVRLPDHYTVINNQIIHYNYERDDIYFGSNFYVKGGKVHHLKDHEIMLDTYIFDIKNRTISDPTTSMVLKVPEAQNSFLEQVYRFSYGTDLPKIPSDQLNIRKISDSDVEIDEATLSIIMAEAECKRLRSKFPCVLLNELKGHKVRVTKDKAGHHLMADDTLILSVRDGAITELNLPTTTKIENFLPHNTTLETFNAPNLTEMGNRCFEWNKRIKTLDLPALKTMGEYCFSENRIMESINLPVLTTMGAFSFTHANVKSLDFPKLETMGERCFIQPHALESLRLPVVTVMGDDCFWHAPLLKSLYAPKLTKRPANFNIEHITSDLDEKGLELFSEIGQSMELFSRKSQSIMRQIEVSEAEAEAVAEAEANQADKKGISAKLTPAADMGQGKAPKKQSAPNSAFQKELQKRLTPDK